MGLGLGQIVHALTSKEPWELRWGARFRRSFDESESGEPLGIDVSRLDEHEPAALPAASRTLASQAGGASPG